MLARVVELILRFWYGVVRRVARSRARLGARQRRIGREARALKAEVLAAGAAFWSRIDTLPFVAQRRRFPPVRTQFYGHGAFMGAAHALFDDPVWRRILGFLMPDVFEAVRDALSDDDDPSTLMGMMENNPVLAAFGTLRAAEASGPDEHPNHLAGLEWDLFVDSALVEASAAARTDAERDAIMARVLDTSLIAHAGTIDTVQESLGISQYEDVRDTPKSAFGGVEMDAWLDLFGRALTLAQAEDFDAAVAAMSTEPRSPRLEACMLHTFAVPWSVERVVEIYRRVTGRPFLSIIIDIKSRDSTPAFLSLLVCHLNASGIHVAGIGSFGFEEIDGVGAVPQRLGDEELPGPREVLFFHFVGDLQLACVEGRLRRGQSVMFNGASLLEVEERGGGQYDFVVPPRLLHELDVWRERLDLQVGVYVQESDCEVGAAAALSEAVETRPETFPLGFAWGGLRDEVGLPPGSLPRAGYGSQLMLELVNEARRWEYDDPGA